MQKTINIDLIKKNPNLFFSQLPAKAELEISEFIYFIIYKYNLTIKLPNNKNIVGYDAKGKSISESEYIEDLEKINKEIDNGTAKLFTSDEVRKRIIDENNLA